MGTAIAQISIHQSRESVLVTATIRGKRRLYTEDLQVGVRLYATFVPTRSVAIEGRMAHHVVQIDAAKRLSEFLLSGRQNRKYDFNDQFRLRLLFGCVDRSGGPKNVGCCYAVALASKPITAAGTTKALEDTVARQRLQYRLQISRWQTMPRFESLGGNGPPVFLQRHINDRGDGKESFA